jgi:putative endonuclease
LVLIRNLFTDYFSSDLIVVIKIISSELIVVIMVVQSGLNRDKMGCVEFICLYIISTHIGTHYTGITNNLVRRWKEHSNGQSSYLSKYVPKEVIYVEFFVTRKLAARKEKEVKRVGAGQYLRKLKYRL